MKAKLQRLRGPTPPRARTHGLVSPCEKADLFVERVVVAYHGVTNNKIIGCSGLVGDSGSWSWSVDSWKIDYVGSKDLKEMRVPSYRWRT